MWLGLHARGWVPAKVLGFSGIGFRGSYDANVRFMGCGLNCFGLAMR